MNPLRKFKRQKKEKVEFDYKNHHFVDARRAVEDIIGIKRERVEPVKVDIEAG